MKKSNVFAYFERNAERERIKRCYRTDAEEALKIKEQNEFLDKVKAAAKEETKLQIKELVDKLAALEAKDSKATEIIEALKKNLVEIEADYKAFKEKGGNLSPAANSIKEQLKKAYEANKDKLTAFKNKESQTVSFDIDVKAAITMLESASLGGSNYLPKPDIRPGYIDLVRNMPLIEQYANGGSTSSALMVWVNKYNPQGTSAMTAEGAAMPLVSVELKTENSNAVLIGAYETISIQMIDDIDFVAAMIEGELQYKVNIAVDGDLISGSGAGGNLKGITTDAVAYTNTNIVTSDANDFDAIRAIIGQMRNLNFFPNMVFINPLDGANMDLTKDLYGRPIAMEYKEVGGDGSDTVFRLKIVESPQIPVGSVLVADMSKFWVFSYMPFQVQYGWINDNLIKNLITLTGNRRLHAYKSLNHLNGFVYDTFANVKLAIAPLP